MTTALFWVVTQQQVVILYRRFETFLEDGTDRLPRNVGKKLLLVAA